jgi:hypothetical protein
MHEFFVFELSKLLLVIKSKSFLDIRTLPRTALFQSLNFEIPYFTAHISLNLTSLTFSVFPTQ